MEKIELKFREPYNLQVRPVLVLALGLLGQFRWLGVWTVKAVLARHNQRHIQA